MNNPDQLFTTLSADKFNDFALEIFYFQYKNNKIFKQFVDLSKYNVKMITNSSDFPFLPINFFKTHKVVSGIKDYERIFKSSSTTGINRSEHYIYDSSIYEKSLTKGFEIRFGDPKEYVFLALLPNYLEQGDSSLVYMVSHLIKLSENKDSGFYLYDHSGLYQKIEELKQGEKKIFIIGVSYALLDFVDEYKMEIPNAVILETGGMKGRKEELTKEELYKKLKEGFGSSEIQSEYGMTELLSQAYLKNGWYYPPPWMKVIPYEINDPFTKEKYGRTARLNIIDLANYHSCSFIATQDIGVVNEDGGFRIVGRLESSDLRGCSLMVSDN